MGTLINLRREGPGRVKVHYIKHYHPHIQETKQNPLPTLILICLILQTFKCAVKSMYCLRWYSSTKRVLPNRGLTVSPGTARRRHSIARECLEMPFWVCGRAEDSTARPTWTGHRFASLCFVFCFFFLRSKFCPSQSEFSPCDHVSRHGNSDLPSLRRTEFESRKKRKWCVWHISNRNTRPCSE